ncbi:hypothetical protein [Crenothrix polyspora]|uniref:EVE domain-containing protein n=1 Tax=Crenothrix polyspora TaxID=360316 RepID=A0A1R4HH40_9GAMM|nr:hypothetical protein [Crenothrix polyspora]SJM95529.1 conserved hypothetical protein [Crenothrix polyspora]
MSIEKFITDKTQQKANTEAVTLRLASDTVAIIDEFSSTLGVTRQEVIAEFVKDSLERALAHYEEMQNTPDPIDHSVDNDDEKSPRYVFLNTNKRNSHDDHSYMISNGIAAAFYNPWKFKIDTLKKGDVIFLYESGAGIVGVGKADGNTEILDKGKDVGETHQQKLINYRSVKPFSAREIKKLTGTNMRFLHTMFKVKAAHGDLIEQQLK